MLKELDTVALTHSMKKFGLVEGDVGAIVHRYDNNRFEVEFVTAQGETIAVLTLEKSDIRPLEKREILHVRGLNHVAA